jgi:hypothetical protein
MNPEARLFWLALALSSSGLALIAAAVLTAGHEHRKGDQ